MAANFTVKEKSMGELVVTIEGDAWKNAVEKSFHKLAQKAEIDGFRKGQVPLAILEKRIPKTTRQAQAIDDNANEWFINGIQEAKVNPISRPDMDVESFDDDKVVVVYRFAVMPEVKLGEYKGLPYALEEAKVTKEELNNEIDRMRNTYMDFVTKDSQAKLGDTVLIDYEGFKDGVAFEGGKADNYRLELGSGQFIPGFEDQLVGVKAGDEKDLNLTFPEEYHAKDLAGKEVVFKVKVHEVQEKVLPELNDDFAKDVNIPGVETVDDLKKRIQERLEEGKKNAAEQKADAELLEAVAANAEIDIPDVLVQEEQQNMMNELAARIQQYGMTVEQYLSMMGQDPKEFMKGYEEDARKAVKNRLVLAEIAKREEINPSDEDVAKEYERIASQYQMEVDQVKTALPESYLREDLKNMKAFDFLKENAEKKTVKAKRTKKKAEEETE